jgi:ubiquinone/menaquinone biosynthesis C-methylase UbiE
VRNIERSGFYERVVSTLVEDRVIRPDMTVLVSCGGDKDRSVLLDLGFRHVTITNVDSSGEGERYRPFDWSYQDAENLSYADESFDVCVVSAGLHHCHSPHRALLELVRTARRCVVMIEARDSALLRVAERVGLTETYEVSAVAHQGLRAGGVRNSSTPNFVYRWTERELEKTIAAYLPHARTQLRYFHELELPAGVHEIGRSSVRGSAVRLAAPIVTGLARLFPSQSNQFGVLISKPVIPYDLQPWMTVIDGRPEPNASVIRQRYRIGGD